MVARASAACFRLLLRLYPPAFRARYGGEMLHALERERSRVARERGAWSGLRYSLAACIDLMRSGLDERFRDRGRRERVLLSGILLDVRYALRSLRRAPVFSAIAIACLSVGIAVNGAAFSVLDALLLRDLPGVERQKELSSILLSHETRWGRTDPGQLSPLEWELFRDHMPVFTRSGVVGSSAVALRLSGGALAVRADFVSGDFFAMLGTRPAAGRLLTAGDDAPGAPLVVVISHDLWTREYQQRADAVGRSLRIGDVVFTIVGVAPAGFVGIYAGELTADPRHGAPWVILPLSAAALVRPQSRSASTAAALDDNWLVLVGRRGEDVTEPEVEAAARIVTTAMAAAYPAHRRNTVAEARSATTATSGQIIAGFAFAMAIPLLIMLIVCANLANQLLARAVYRSREIALRLSLGVSRARLLRLLLVESTLLAAAASVVGYVLARVLIDALRAFALVLPFTIPMDVRVVLFMILVAFATSLAFGLVPSLRATRLDLAQSIRAGQSSGGANGTRLRAALVVTQVAASVALLALSGVFVRGAQRSRMSEDEANVDRVLSVGVDLDMLGYEATAGLAFQAMALDRLRSLPGVEAVAQSAVTPDGVIRPARVALPRDAADHERYLEVATVGGDWFALRNTRPLMGRLFTEAEARRGTPVAVVDNAAAQRLWPEQSAVGQTLQVGEVDNAIAITVIGIVPTVRDRHGHQDNGVVIVPASGAYEPRAYFYLRTRGNAADLREAARDIIRDLDPRLPGADVVTLGESLDRLGATVALLATGVGAMGTIALLLAALGLSAVLSFIVEQRRYEIGVRVALGARTPEVTWLVMRESLRLTVIGVILGTLVAGTVARIMRGILFGLPPIDPVAFAGSTAVILLVATLSSAGPAWRAANVDPSSTLKSV
jgi:predicted permease